MDALASLLNICAIDMHNPLATDRYLNQVRQVIAVNRPFGRSLSCRSNITRASMSEISLDDRIVDDLSPGSRVVALPKARELEDEEVTIAVPSLLVHAWLKKTMQEIYPETYMK